MTAEFEITVDVVPAAPVGAPADFRERLALHLKTTDPERLQAVESCFKGVWGSEHEYIADQVAEHLPPFLGWLVTATDPRKLRDGYCGRALHVWSIPLESGSCMVFEALVDSQARAKLEALELPQEEEKAESPCPACGRRDWSVTHWTEDLQYLGCDLCSPTR